MKKCTTHHHACDCREFEFAKLRAFARRVITICAEGDPHGDFVLEMAVSEGLLRLVPSPNGGTCGGKPAMRYEPTECLGSTLAPNNQVERP